MKEKILAAIRAKFPSVTLSKKRLDSIAAVIEGDVIDDETKIDAALTTYNKYNPVADMAKQDADLRGLNKKVGELESGKKTTTTTPETKTENVPVDEDTPVWAKALIEQNKTLATDLAAIKGEKTASTIRAKVTEMLNEKGKEVPASYWGKRSLPEKEEDMEAFATEVRTDYAAFAKEMTDKGLSVLSAPRSGAPVATGTKAINPEVKQFMESKKGPSPVNGTAAPVQGAATGFINTPAPL